MRLIYARGFEYTSIRVTLRSGFSKALIVTSFVERKKNIGERTFILRNTAERVSRDLHQIPKEVYPMMNLATIFSSVKSYLDALSFFATFEFSTLRIPATKPQIKTLLK